MQIRAGTQMKPSVRLGMIGIGALALLTLVHWLRSRWHIDIGAVRYLLGVAPNFAAAIAIPFVVTSIYADQKPDGIIERSARVCRTVALVSCAGLIGWELFQQTSRKLVFDVHDIGATLLGTAAAILLARIVGSSRSATSGRPINT